MLKTDAIYDRTTTAPEGVGGKAYLCGGRRTTTAASGAGFLDAILRQLTGHSTEAMTEHYSHFRLEDFKPIVANEESLGI